VPLASSGPMCNPPLRTLAASWRGRDQSAGRVVVLGSADVLSGEWLRRQENSRACDALLQWLHPVCSKSHACLIYLGAMSCLFTYYGGGSCICMYKNKSIQKSMHTQQSQLILVIGVRYTFGSYALVFCSRVNLGHCGISGSIGNRLHPSLRQSSLAPWCDGPTGDATSTVCRIMDFLSQWSR
jgi:hypothetical protein